MASAVTVIFGANSTQFQAELARMQAMTIASSRRMASAASSGHMVGTTGIVRETAVIGREIAQGRGIGRILASLTLLTQYLSSASRNAQQGASAARMLADGYSEAAFKANVAAVAAMRKAEATAAEAEAEGFEVDATLVAADADMAEARSANATAAALARKAEAAEVDAVAQEADAAATAGAGLSWIAIAGIFTLVALAAGVLYERIWGIKNLLKNLGFDTSSIDIKEDYIPLLKRHLNDVRNAQKEVTDEVKKTVDAYNSAAEAAKRQAADTKEHYDHLKRMLELQKEIELAGTNKRPAEKEAIEAKYSAQQLQLQKDRQQSELADKLTEKTNLEIESKTKLQQADAIKVNTKEEDQKLLGELNKKAEVAEKFLKGGGVWDEVKKTAAIGAMGVSAGLVPAINLYKTIQATEAGGNDSAKKTIADRNKFADKVQSNDEIRQTKENLVKEAAKSAGEAAKIGLDIPNITKKTAGKNIESSEEAAAKLAAEKAKDLAGGAEKGYELNSAQKIGAYAATAPILLQQLNTLRSIDNKVTPNRPPTNHPPGERKPQLSPAPQSTVNGNVFSFPRPHDYGN